MPDNDTLEAVLLRKAASIGAPKLPEVTEQGMPLSPLGLGGGGNISSLMGLSPVKTTEKILTNGWLHPAGRVSGNSLVNELKRLAEISLAGRTVDGVRKFAPDIKKYLNKGADYMLGYDPEAVPVGTQVPSNRP